MKFADDSTVELKTKDGKVVDVPLKKLSESDQAYAGCKNEKNQLVSPFSSAAAN